MISPGPTRALVFGAPDELTAPSALASTSASIEELIRAHGDFVWRSVKRLGVLPGEVDDVTQRVFLQARDKLAAIPAGGERGYLYRLAFGLASNERRAQRRRREAGPVDPERTLSQATPVDDRLAQRQLLDLLLEPIALELRAVLVLTEGEGLSAPEIARLLEIPVGTVTSRLRRAREEMQASLARHRARQRSSGETP